MYYICDEKFGAILCVFALRKSKNGEQIMENEKMLRIPWVHSFQK